MSFAIPYTKLSDTKNIPLMGIGTADPMYGCKIPSWILDSKEKLIPRIVYNFYKIGRKKLFRSILQDSINLGYRLIDTSSVYNNEKLIGEVISKSRIPRSKFFIITRVSNRQQYEGNIEKSLIDSLEKLGVQQVDLYMFHWPVTNKYIETWKEMENLYKKGLVRTLGVANCHEYHLKSIFNICRIRPIVNEIEIHPLMNQKKLINFCKTHNIKVIAYTPLGRFHEKLRNNKILKIIAEKYNKSIPQIILRWHFQNDVITIPRSTNMKHLKNNIDIFNFSLTNYEMKLLDSINEDLRLRYNPDNCDFTKL